MSVKIMWCGILKQDVKKACNSNKNDWNTFKSGYINFEQALKVSREFFDAHPGAHVRRYDILIASTGSGSMGNVDIYDRDEPAMISGELLALRLRKDFDPYFIAYFLRSPLGQAQFDKWFSGSSGQILLRNF